MGAPLDAQEHESVCVCVCLLVFACVWLLPELQAVAQNHYEAVCVCVCVFACVCVCVCQKRCFKYALALDELVGGLQSLSCM